MQFALLHIVTIPTFLALGALVSKRELGPAQILLCDERGGVVGRTPGRPSAETFLHIEIARRRRAAAKPYYS